jgi:hypothetical protein
MTIASDTQSSSTTQSEMDTHTKSEPFARMMQQRKTYAEQRTGLIARLPILDNILPQDWPTSIASLDQTTTVKALRGVLGALNEGLLIIGFGDGSIINYLRHDPRGRNKLIHLVILPEEVEAYAHALGAMPWNEIFSQLRLSLCVTRSLDDLRCDINSVYAEHGDIARLAGTAIVHTHALSPAAEKRRNSWLPQIKKIVIERFDCIGNDVYDTFLGAKHALMHGDLPMRLPRSSDYHNHYKGKTALCIASGPSTKKYLEQIKAIQHEHVIICADSIFGCLVDNGINPDFVTMVERTEDLSLLVKNHGHKTTTTIFALPVVHPESTAPFADRVAWWWNGDDLFHWLDENEPRLYTGRSTGTMSIALAGLLGIEKAYLIGHDLAYKDGKTHADGVAAHTAEAVERDRGQYSANHPSYYFRLFDVPRNGGGMIQTNGGWELFRSDIEQLIMSFTATEYINTNINSKDGAIIAGTHPGDIPSVTGIALKKSHPHKTFDEKRCQDYARKCKTLVSDFDAIEKKFSEISQKLKEVKPLQLSRREVEEFGQLTDLTNIVSKENAKWFAYVFRAALRNLMLKLHYNTFVGTMAERNWNQVLAMRLYIESIPILLGRLRPELEKALESFK